MRAAAGAVAIAAILPGCGGSAGDLLAIEVSGGSGGDAVRLVVTEDGRGRCDDGGLVTIPSRRLIEAREVERELEPLATEGASFAAPAEPGAPPDAPTSGEDRRSYVARSQDGTVRWAEGAPRLPSVLPEAALLAERLRADLCPT